VPTSIARSTPPFEAAYAMPAALITGPGTTGPSSRRCQRTWTEVGPATIAAP